MFDVWYFCIACAIIFVISIIIIFKSNLSEILCYSLSISSGLTAIILFITAVALPKEADKEIKYYKDQQKSTYILYIDFLRDENSFKIENEERILYYISEINEYNDWLKEARNSQTAQGCFSKYYNKDLSQFEYIYVFLR